jgi:FPC/CPF motif-containing protein YcgG
MWHATSSWSSFPPLFDFPNQYIYLVKFTNCEATLLCNYFTFIFHFSHPRSHHSTLWHLTCKLHCLSETRVVPRSRSIPAWSKFIHTYESHPSWFFRGSPGFIFCNTPCSDVLQHSVRDAQYPLPVQSQKYYFSLDANTNFVFPTVEEIIRRSRTATNKPLIGRNRRGGDAD